MPCWIRRPGRGARTNSQVKMGSNPHRWDLKKGIRVGGMETKQRRRKNTDEAENWCLMPPVDQRPSRNVDCVWSIFFASRKGIPLGMRIGSGSAVGRLFGALGRCLHLLGERLLVEMCVVENFGQGFSLVPRRRAEVLP